jgi:hypothetical protein
MPIQIECKSRPNREFGHVVLVLRSERKVGELSTDFKAPHRAIRRIDRQHSLSLILTMEKTCTGEKKKQDNQTNQSHHRIPFLATAY